MRFPIEHTEVRDLFQSLGFAFLTIAAATTVLAQLFLRAETHEPKSIQVTTTSSISMNAEP